ncbi:MAG: esterase/lipase family protein [Caldimonas sp.]
MTTGAFFIRAPNMLARIQQLTTLTLACAAFGAFLLGARYDRPSLGFAFLAVVIAGYAGVLAAEFVLVRRSFARDDALRPRTGQLVRAWAAEAIVAPRVFLWQQPFRSASEPDHLPTASRGRRGLVLVHGFFCNRGLWNPWLRRLRAEDIAFVAVNLEPVLGSIDDYGPTVAAAVAAVEDATGLAPVVVAHSMGGLAARAWLAADPRARVHRLITVASPHAGTLLAGRGHGGNVVQMGHGGRWLAALAEDTATSRTDVVCFWSHCDNIVIPCRSATLAGADNRHLDGTPHVAMVFHPAVFEEALRSVGAST